jgi:hypothetical protein
MDGHRHEIASYPLQDQVASNVSRLIFDGMPKADMILLHEIPQAVWTLAPTSLWENFVPNINQSTISNRTGIRALQYYRYSCHYVIDLNKRTRINTMMNRQQAVEATLYQAISNRGSIILAFHLLR